MSNTTELPIVSIKFEGTVSLIDNLGAFGDALTKYITGLNKTPTTDEDFGALDQAVKVLKNAETALSEAEAVALSQTTSIDTMRKTVAQYKDLARTNRLMAEKIVATEKEARRRAIVDGAVAELAEHVDGLNKSIGKPYMPSVLGSFPDVVKGLKTIASITSAVKAELDRCKLQANAVADNIRANMATLRELAKDHVFLFADTAQIVHKLPDDLTALVKARISDYEKVEAERLEKERARILEEERVRAEAAERARVQAEQAAELAIHKNVLEEKTNTNASLNEARAANAIEPSLLNDLQKTVDFLAAPSVAAVGAHDAIAKAMAPALSRPRPSDEAIIHALSLYFKATPEEVKGWIVFVGGTTL